MNALKLIRTKKSTPTLTIPNKALDTACESVARWTGIRPTRTQLLALIKDDTSLAAEIATCSKGLDTAPREWLMDKLAEHLLKETWPSNSDGSEKAANFYKRLIRAARRQKYKVVNDAVQTRLPDDW